MQNKKKGLDSMQLKDLRCVEDISAEKYVEYYNSIRNAMTCPDWLAPFDEDVFNMNNEIGGKTWVFFDGDEIACTVMYMPASAKFLGKAELLVEVEKVGECGPIMVSPNYRGMGLQKEMLEHLENYCKSLNQTYILTTIHPDNEFSSKNFKKCGYIHHSTLTLKRGDRDLFLKQI